jgi:signal transduction histidine kinase
MNTRAQEIFNAMKLNLTCQTDRLFGKIMIFQWLASIAIAYGVSPSTWNGETSTIHPHVWAAIVLGGLISVFGWMISTTMTGKPTTKHLIAVSQMFMSALIIHVSGGRLESHFHVFGSLAFLAFYRDPTVLITASVVTAADHFLRGIYWPMSAYGEAAVGTWRWLEHGAWVIFEDLFLIISCIQDNKHMQNLAERQASLEEINTRIEEEIAIRTQELADQRAITLSKEKMAGLGEMAAGMAHEINNPVAFIKLSSEQLEDVLSDETPDIGMCRDMVVKIQSTADRIGKIIRSLKSFARDGGEDPMVSTSVNQIIEETIILCNEKFRNRKVELRYKSFPADLKVNCRSVQISQIILNLMQNSIDAVENLPERWTEISYVESENELKIMVTDSGNGIPENIRDKILQPFFTTKEVGKGTGLGLSISRNIMAAHNGSIDIDSKHSNTRFVLTFKRDGYGKQAA